MERIKLLAQVVFGKTRTRTLLFAALAALLLCPSLSEAWRVDFWNYSPATKIFVVHYHGSELCRTTVESRKDAGCPLPGAMCATGITVLNADGSVYYSEISTARFPLAAGTPTCWNIGFEVWEGRGDRFYQWRY